MITHRIKYETENLTKDDFINGIGFDTSLYNKYRNIRNIPNDDTHDYYCKTFTSIEGVLRVKKDHHLLNKVMVNIDSENDREVVIESVHKHWYFGFYWAIVYRTLGTNSHGLVFYENINSVSDIIIEGVAETKRDFKFK